MYRNLEEVVADSGICRTEILHACNNGDVGFYNYGYGVNNIKVNEDDVIDLMIKRENH